VEKRVTPPTLEKSVEDAYRTYLSDAKTQTIPVTPQSYAILTPVSEDSTSSLSDITLKSGLASLPDEPMNTELEAPPSHDILPDRVSMDIFDGSNRSQSTSRVLACATPPLRAFSLAAASRFAAAGLYRVKCLPAQSLPLTSSIGYLEAPVTKEEKHRRMAVRRLEEMIQDTPILNFGILDSFPLENISIIIWIEFSDWQK